MKTQQQNENVADKNSPIHKYFLNTIEEAETNEIKQQKQEKAEQKNNENAREQKKKASLQIIKKSKKAFIGTGFTLDINQFLKFKNGPKTQPGGTIGTIFYQISAGGISWLILLYSVINASFFPICILSLKINKFVVLSWRFALQSFIMIPFILHQKRTITEHDSHKYRLSYILNKSNLKRLYVHSFSNVMWYGIILTAGQYTYLSHAFYLGSLANFFLSLSRHRQRHVHEFQVGGQLLIIIGIFFIFYDTLTFRQSAVEPSHWNTLNHQYLLRSKHQRIIADVVSLLMSLVIFWFQNLNLRLRHVFPPYLTMLILNIMNTINLVFLAFFFNGVTFDSQNIWGIFSIFEDNKFATLLYTVLILCTGMVTSFTLVVKLFPNFVLPTLTYFLQPGIVTGLFHLSNIQALPGSFSFIGYIMLTPGMGMILIGQWLFIRFKLHSQLTDIFPHHVQLKQLKQSLIQQSQEQHRKSSNIQSKDQSNLERSLQIQKK